MKTILFLAALVIDLLMMLAIMMNVYMHLLHHHKKLAKRYPTPFHLLFSLFAPKLAVDAKLKLNRTLYFIVVVLFVFCLILTASVF